MCPSKLGRVQTRFAILIIPAILWTIVSLVTGRAGYILIIGIYFVIGVILDVAVYPYIIKWQPPWLTFTLAVGEFFIVYFVVKIIDNEIAGAVIITNTQAIFTYWITWWIAIWTKVVILPLLSLSWVEDAGEFRQTGWSVPPDYTPLPISAFQETSFDDKGVPALARQFSSVNEIPAELRNLPSPSGVHRIPQPRPA
jgi:hypothetical protein